MTAYWTSLALVLLAEMGDKTQLMAMALACRYPWRKVLLGILAGSLVSHFLASLVGSSLPHLASEGALQAGASFSFVLFGLWTLAAGSDVDETRSSRYGPFLTVFLAFSLAELGDKTELASVALAARFGTFLPVWMGATTAMMIANAPAVLAGAAFCRRLPRRALRLLSATAFILFGLIGFWPLLGSPGRLVPVFAVILGLAWFAYRRGETHSRTELCRKEEKTLIGPSRPRPGRQKKGGVP